MEEEFKLSEKRKMLFKAYSEMNLPTGDFIRDIKEQDREFIRRLKEDDVEELAKFIHSAYETLARMNKWNTQESCKVLFEELPEENKKTMLQLASHLICRNNVKIDALAGDL